MRSVSGRLRFVLAASLVAALAPLAAQQQAPRGAVSQLTWFDRAGTVLGRLGPLADHGNLELSPDGSRVAVAVADRAAVRATSGCIQTASGQRQQFTSDPADENWLIFSPDGRRVVVQRVQPRSDRASLRSPAAAARARGSGARRSGRRLAGELVAGRQRPILVVTNSPKTGNDIWTLSLAGDRTPRRISAPRPRRTGRRSRRTAAGWRSAPPPARTCRRSTCTRFPTPGQAWRVSADGGSTQARWRRDGKEIFYVAPDRQLMSAAVTLGRRQREDRSHRSALRAALSLRRLPRRSTSQDWPALSSVNTSLAS